MSTRKLIYHVAISIDGYIAQENDNIELFPTEGDHIPDYIQSLTEYDTAIMGRRTYEFGYKYGLNPGDNPYPHMNTYVYSSGLDFKKKDDNLYVVRDDVVSHVIELKEQSGTPIYLCGGGILASFLLGHGLIDEVHLKYCPIIIGSGIPIFNGRLLGVKLERKHVTTYDNGVLLIHYAVV